MISLSLHQTRPAKVFRLALAALLAPASRLVPAALLIPALLLAASAPSAAAQISLPTAVNLALQNNPKVKIAQADLSRAKAVLSESHDVYIPAVAATGGVGSATGAPLSPPVVFSVAAQSLVYNFSQPDYIRAAHAGVSSAQLALAVARTDVAEDVTTTYVSLDNALERRRVLDEGFGIANRLVTIVENRFTAGVDPHIEVTRAHRTAAQIHLQRLLADDEVAGDVDHLAALTGLPAGGWTTDPNSIPQLQAPRVANEEAREDPAQNEGTSAAFESARAKQLTAHGESRYLLRPQLSFSAQYSKLSDAFTTYDFYYPGFSQRIVCNPRCVSTGQSNSFNSLSIAVQLTMPLLDMVHRARAREAAIDAQRAFLDAEVQQIAFLENRYKLMHSTQELAARAELATLDHDLAQDQLEAIAVRLRAPAGALTGEQMTPKDGENARLAERQRQVDVLDAELQLRRAEISLLRQAGSLDDWLAATIPGATAAPAAPAAAPAITPTLPVTIGTPPDASTAPGIAPAPATTPTSGTVPSTLPSAPVSNPAPAVPVLSAPGTSLPGTPAPAPHP